MKIIIPIALILVLVSSCASRTTTDWTRDNLKKLIGTWSFEQSGLTETWTKIDEQHFQGTINRDFNGVLEPLQHIDIRFHGDSINYVGTRIGAHESSPPIRFDLESATENNMMFINASGGFPQKMNYEIINDDRFSVIMSGTQDGKSRSQQFNYRRVQD